MEGHLQGGGKATSVVAKPADLSNKQSGRSTEQGRKHQQHLETVNIERNQTSKLLMGIELGAHTSAVVCGAVKTVEETGCAESDPRITKAYAPSWVAFDRQIITYGEEAAAYAVITPRETLANLPLWLTVEDVDQAQELEERVKCAPYPRVRLHRGNIFFEIHQDAERKEVPLAVALGLLLQHLQVVGDPSEKEHRRRVVKLTGSLHMSSYDAASSVIRHPAAACIVVPSATSPLNVEALQAAACIAGLSPPYVLRRIDALINRFVCEKLDHIYHHFWQQQQKLLHHHHPHHRNSLRRDVYVALLDFNFLETSLAVLRLHSLAPASSDFESGATTARGDQAAEEETRTQQGRIRCAVLAERVDASIGFSDVISSVAHHVAAHLKKHCDAVVKSHTRDSWRLHAACVRAVEELYDVEETMIDLDYIAPEGTNTGLRLTQHHFEKICQPLAEHVERFVRETLDKAGVSPDQVSLTEIASVNRCARMRWLLERLDRIRGVDAAPRPARAAAVATATGEAAEVEAAAAAESACPAGLPGISPELFSFPTQLRFLQSSAAAAVGALYFCAARGQFAPALLQKPQLDHAKRLDREEGNLAAGGNNRIHEVTADVWRSMAADARAEDGEDIGALSQIAHHLLAEEAKELQRRSIAAYLEYNGGTPCDVFGDTEKPKHHHHQSDSGRGTSDGGSSNSEDRDADGKGILGRMRSFLRRAANASQEEVQEKYEELRAFLLREHKHKAQTLTQDTRESHGAKREQRQETLGEEREKAQQDEEEGEQGEDEEVAAASSAEEDEVGARNSASIKEKELKEPPLREPHATMDMQRLMLELKVHERKDKPLRYYLDKLDDNIKEARGRNENGHSDLALYLAQRAAETLQQIVSLQESTGSASSSSSSQSAWLKVIEVDIQVEMARASLASAEVEHAVSLRKQKLYDAVKHCDNALSKSPDRPEAFYCRSKAFLLLGEYRQAYEDCTAGVALAPHDKHMQGLRLVIERYIEVEERPGT